MDDLGVAETDDGEAPQPKLGIVRDVLRSLPARRVELETVDLKDEAIADEEVRESARELHLLANAQTPASQRDHHERLETRVGKALHFGRKLARRA